MRTNGFRILSVALAMLAACGSESRGGGHADAGATAGGSAGSAGKDASGTSGRENGGRSASSGSSGSSGASGSASGAAGTSGNPGSASAGGAGTSGGVARGGSAGTGGNSTPSAGDGGALSSGGSPGGAGALSSEGGAAGEAGAAGASGVAGGDVVGLSWPIDCIPNETCVRVGYPDTDEDGEAFDCGEPGYFGHAGTDIDITVEAQDAGTAVRAAADGIVLFAFDGKYDRCPNASEPDCQPPPSDEPGATTGYSVCTPLGPYCGVGVGSCFWCFAGGNVIVIRHDGVPGVFATRYDHLKRNSVLVEPGATVLRGQKIAEAASAGNSTAPHLHFEVWGTGFYELAEPWAGPCGPNTGPSLWAHDPPWSR